MAGTIHHYKASNVIDFAWAADPDFIEETVDVDGVTLVDSPSQCGNRQQLDGASDYAAKAMAYINEDIGPYMYPEYTVIQGGDGGMEYPMIT